jgi:hypothetical protein
MLQGERLLPVFLLPLEVRAVYGLTLKVVGQSRLLWRREKRNQTDLQRGLELEVRAKSEGERKVGSVELLGDGVVVMLVEAPAKLEDRM